MNALELRFAKQTNGPESANSSFADTGRRASVPTLSVSRREGSLINGTSGGAFFRVRGSSEFKSPLKNLIKPIDFAFLA